MKNTNQPTRLVSLNIGLPREVTWHGTPVTTGIFKHPVSGRIPLRKLNLDGDRQADLTVHGGEFKAVYCYPSAHYEYWKRELPGRDLPLAIFGENFTTDGLFEDSVHLGDVFSVGSAQVVVTQPRLPCYKLGNRHPNAAPVSETPRLYIAKSYSDDDLTSLRRAVKVEALPASWKDYFRERLQKTDSSI